MERSQKRDVAFIVRRSSVQPRESTVIFNTRNFAMKTAVRKSELLIIVALVVITAFLALSFVIS
jgi:hypothetical protein